MEQAGIPPHQSTVPHQSHSPSSSLSSSSSSSGFHPASSFSRFAFCCASQSCIGAVVGGDNMSVAANTVGERARANSCSGGSSGKNAHPQA